MSFAALAIIFAAGFVIMTPIGPVSTICIRRSLIYGRRAGVAAGTGNAVAMSIYATLGVVGSMRVSNVFGTFSTACHVAISFVLVGVAILILRTRPALPTLAPATRGSLTAGFGAALVIALANPADIVLFATLFAGLGIVVVTPLQYALFFVTIFAGGCVYWLIMSSFLVRWRLRLTIGRMRWLNRTCAAFMLIGAAASLLSMLKPAS